MEDFEAWTIAYGRTIERLVKYKIPNKEDAEDVLQEIWIKAYRHQEELKDPGSAKAWLIRIACNHCNDYFRRQAGQMQIPLDEVEETLPSGGGLYGHEERLKVRNVVESLKDQNKQILYLYYFKDLPQEEIARRLNIPPGTVKSRLHNARKEFKGKYEQDDI